MKIHSLYYKNLLQGWELEEVHFSDLNVLVGISGAGKTQIVNAIQNLAEIADGKVTGGIEWKIKFSVGQDEYIWQGTFSDEHYIESQLIALEAPIEKLIYNEIEVAIQEKGRIKYKGISLPKIGQGQSLIKLLSEVEIECARVALQTIILKDYRNYEEDTMPYQLVEKVINQHQNLMAIKNSKLPLIVKYHAIRTMFPNIDEQIKQNYIEIFPQVVNIFTAFNFSTNKESMLEICIEVHDKYGAISQSQISSGMFRTLMGIIELYLCHEESLFLLDEFENSLGFNCLDKMFELIENKAYSGENQFILTTHNPYIIRNTDLSAIKIVTRKGNKIIVKNAIDMGLAESAQDNFFKIINLKEFREGVSA